MKYSHIIHCKFKKQPNSSYSHLQQILQLPGYTKHQSFRLPRHRRHMQMFACTWRNVRNARHNLTVT